MTMHSHCTDLHKGDTEEFEKIHIDEIALKNIFETVERIRDRKGCLGSQDEWFERVCPSYSVKLSHDPAQVIADKAALERTMQTRDVLKSSADALCKIQKQIARQLETCEEDIETYKRRQGFFLLPDEVLALVLEFAAWEPGQTRQRSFWTVEDRATVLSHVCTRFREIITRCSSLWRDVHSGRMNPAKVSTFLSRCRGGDGEVSFTNSLFEKRDNTSFIQAALDYTESWGKFTLYGHVGNGLAARTFEDYYLQDHNNLRKDLILPNLTHIAIHYPHPADTCKVENDDRFRGAINFYTSWETPKLRSFVAKNFVPVLFSGARTLSSLRISLEGGSKLQLNTVSIVDFISGCPCLESLALGVREANLACTPSHSSPRHELLRVSELDLDIIRCNTEVIKTLFNAIGFPNVKAMELFIIWNGDDRERNEHFNHTFDAIIPNAKAFPILTDLTLRASMSNGWREVDGGSIWIPFERIPALRVLDLETKRLEVHPLPVGIVLPPMRSLLFRNCSRISRTWVVALLKQLKAQGNLDSLDISLIGGQTLESDESWEPSIKEDIQALGE